MPRTKHRIQPIERFPAKPRPDGRFQKRIHGRVFYFGRDGNRNGALEEYERVKATLYSGRASRSSREPADKQTITLGEVGSDYIDFLMAEREAGRCSAVHLRHTLRAVLRFIKRTGDAILVDALRVEDFTGYGRYLSGKLGDHAYNRERSIIGAMFNCAEEHDWIDRAPKIGRGFKKVSRATIRTKRKINLATPLEYVALLAYAAIHNPELEAMLLLAGNCGYGSSDCGHLEWTFINLDEAMVKGFLRPKTNVNRDNPLWPETVEALRGLERRKDDPAVFRTLFDNKWSGEAVGHEMQKLVAAFNAERKAIGLEPAQMTMYRLRHTFATYASEARDSDAWRRVMGHISPGLKDTYIETLFAPRLRALVGHVRDRLLLGREAV